MATRAKTVVASLMLACVIPFGCSGAQTSDDDGGDNGTGGGYAPGGAYAQGGTYPQGGASPQGGTSQGGTGQQGGATQGGAAPQGGSVPTGGSGAEPQGGAAGMPQGGSGGAPPTCTPDCRPDQTCTNGTCACASGFLECGGTCVASDGMNCGACGRACTGTQVCSNGTCSASGCLAGFTQCGSSCVDLTGHKNNCGACGRACPTDQDCFQSMCRCRTGTASCNGGACQDVYSDEANCGACGMRCATGATCTMGVCVCPNNGMACSGTCYDIASDEQHCGNCTTTCSGSTQCLFGGCVDPASVNCGGSNTGRTCARNAAITLGKYWINNNWWGVASGNNGSANCSATSNFQSIAQRCQQGDLVGWATDWNWSGTGSVMTFASLVFGWQYDDFRIDNTGLPVQLSANRAVNCGWSFTVTGSGTMNVAYDMWLHTTQTPTYNTQPSEEIMVWLHRSGGAGPVGSLQTTVTINGTSWDLYRGTTVQPVYSYVRTQNAGTAVLNMSAFTQDLVTRGWVQSSRYLTSVQAGTEIFTGSGSVTTNGFYCRIQ